MILLWLGCVVGEGIEASRHRGIEASRHRGIKALRHQGIEEEASSFALICRTALMRLLLPYHRRHQRAIVGTNVAFQVDDLLPRAEDERAVAHRHR